MSTMAGGSGAGDVEMSQEQDKPSILGQVTSFLKSANI